MFYDIIGGFILFIFYGIFEQVNWNKLGNLVVMKIIFIQHYV
jgi:hypothetical protein